MYVDYRIINEKEIEVINDRGEIIKITGLNTGDIKKAILLSNKIEGLDDKITNQSKIMENLNDEKISICVKNKVTGIYSYYHTIKLSDEIALNISYMNGLIFENELYRINGYGLLYGLTPVECDYTLKLEKNK